MDKKNKISFTITDTVFENELNPSNLNLPLLEEFIEQVSQFLKGKSYQNLSDIQAKIIQGSLGISVTNSSGSLDEAFTDYMSLKNGISLNDIDPIRAKVIQQWQNYANENNDRVYKVFFGDIAEDNGVLIVSSNTNYELKKEVWVDVELYLYGRVYDMGGKSRPNVHIELENGKTITVDSESILLAQDKKNRLYKNQLLRIKAKKSTLTSALKDEQLVSFENYNPHFNEEEFEKIAKKAKLAWRVIKSPTLWVEEMRGNIE